MFVAAARFGVEKGARWSGGFGASTALSRTRPTASRSSHRAYVGGSVGRRSCIIGANGGWWCKFAGKWGRSSLQKLGRSEEAFSSTWPACTCLASPIVVSIQKRGAVLFT